jgi:hypothetical protein
MIHVEHLPEAASALPELSAVDAGFVLGLLIGEGTFGGDGRQPHVVLRMHVRHETLFLWLKARFPAARLYGPYNHSGRRYYQFMWRGPALREGLIPWLDALPWPAIDSYSHERYLAMKERYGLTGTAGASAGRRSGAESDPASEPSSSGR